jgi:O-antigen ligase
MRTLTYIASLILIFMVPFEGVVRIPGVGTATKLLGFGVAALWLATIVIKGQLRKPSPFHMVVAVFVLWNAVSVFWSGDPEKTIDHVVTWVLLFVLIMILWDLYTTRSALMAGLQAYVLGAYVSLGSQLSNFLAGNAYYTKYDRFSSGDTNPDGLGFLLVLGIPIAWYLVSSASTNKVSSFLKVVNYVYIPAALLGLALSGTRTALLAAVPAMVFGLASLGRIRLWVRVVILLALILVFFIGSPFLQTLSSFQRFSTIGTELGTGDLSGRTIIWGDGLAAFQESPLIGVGSNMYRSVNSLAKLAHNSYLSVLVETGLIGFILFSIILTIVVFQAWGQPKWDKRFWLTMLLVWAIGASTLTWEHRKTTWLFFGLIVVSAALTSYQAEINLITQHGKSFGQLLRPTNVKELPQGK